MTIQFHPIGPTAFDHLNSRLETAERRAVRIETRLVRLMEFMGADTHGDLLDYPPSRRAQRAKELT